jgi:hypothetical protein
MKSAYTTEYLGELILELRDVIFSMSIPTKAKDGYTWDIIEIMEIIETNPYLELNEQLEVISYDKIDEYDGYSFWVIRMDAFMEKNTTLGYIQEILQYEERFDDVRITNYIEKLLGEVDDELNLKEKKIRMMI